jgi:DNA polymerase V
MGFPSPAMDYQEQRLTIDLLCGIDGNCRVIETSCGWAVINVAMRPEQEIRYW